MRKFLKFVLSSRYWSSEGFFSLGKSGKPTLIQAHFILTIPCCGGWLSCRQIIHGDFFLNEVKLLLSAKRVFQKSQPGFRLLPFFVLPPFVSRCGRVTWSRTRQALIGKRKSVLSGDFKLQGSFNYCELCAWKCNSSLLLCYSSFFQGLFLSSMLYSHKNENSFSISKFLILISITTFISRYLTNRTLSGVSVNICYW